ncbi:MAG: DUF2157 domain-containing protein [Bdellovibrionota bacterium]
MKISPEDLQSAVRENIISADQSLKLWDFLGLRNESKSQFSLGHVIYYLGGLIVIGAMSWFMVKAWEHFGGIGIALISLFMGISFFLIGKKLWEDSKFKIPAGILITAAVSITPLFVYGIQKALGYWPSTGSPTSYADYHVYIRGNWIFMELATIGVATLVLKYFRYPFITFPAALALWYLSMDLAPMIMGSEYATWDSRKWVSLYFGLCLSLVSYFIDRRTKEDFAFWCYIVGALTLWGGLSSMSSESELNKLIYCLINLFFIFLSVFLSRRIFIILGSMGVMGYLGHLAHKVFKDSFSFPIVLALFGLLIIYLGIQYQKNKKQLEKWVLQQLPASLLELRPKERL